MVSIETLAEKEELSKRTTARALVRPKQAGSVVDLTPEIKNRTHCLSVALANHPIELDLAPRPKWGTIC